VVIFVLNMLVVVGARSTVPGAINLLPNTPPEVQARAVVDRATLLRSGEQQGYAIVDPATRTVIGVQLPDRQVVTPVRPLEHWGHFSTAKGFFGLEVWRLLTFQFLHFGWLHLGLNMLGLWVFGHEVEEFLGRRRYLALYLACGVFGAVAYLLLNLLGNTLGQTWRVPGLLFDDVTTPLLGASAGIFGIILAAAYIAPQRIVDLLGFIPVKLRVLAYGMLLVAAVQLFMGAPNAGGEAAHIGGAIAGYFFVRRMYLLRDFFDVLGDEPPESGGPGGPSTKPAPTPQDIELDRVLAKLGREGQGALTDAERATLASASRALGGAAPPAAGSVSDTTSGPRA